MAAPAFQRAAPVPGTDRAPGPGDRPFSEVKVYTLAESADLAKTLRVGLPFEIVLGFVNTKSSLVKYVHYRGTVRTVNTMHGTAELEMRTPSGAMELYMLPSDPALRDPILIFFRPVDQASTSLFDQMHSEFDVDAYNVAMATRWFETLTLFKEWESENMRQIGLPLRPGGAPEGVDGDRRDLDREVARVQQASAVLYQRVQDKEPTDEQVRMLQMHIDAWLVRRIKHAKKDAGIFLDEIAKSRHVDRKVAYLAATAKAYQPPAKKKDP